MTSQSACRASAADPRAHHATFAEAAGAAISRAVVTLVDWQQRVSQRRQLLGLDRHLMKDLGIDPADAYREAAKPFWRP